MPVGGGRPHSVSTTYPDVSQLSVHSAGLAPLTGRIAYTWLSRYDFGQETEGQWSVTVGDVAAMKGSHGCHPIQGTVASLPLTGGCAPPVPGVHG